MIFFRTISIFSMHYFFDFAISIISMHHFFYVLVSSVCTYSIYIDLFAIHLIFINFKNSNTIPFIPHRTSRFSSTAKAEKAV